MARLTKTFCSPEVLRQFKGFRTQVLNEMSHPPDDVDQRYLFEELAGDSSTPADSSTLAGEVDMTPDECRRVGQILTARYLAICLGQPLAIIARLLRVHPGTVTRWMQTKLPVTVPAMKPRTAAEKVVHELGMSEVKQPNGHGSRRRPRRND